MSEQNVYDFDIEEVPEDDEYRERFKVTDDSQASWAMRKLLSIRNKMGENESIADSERTRIDTWLFNANHKFDKDVEYFEFILTEYAQQQRSEIGRKSIDTAYGIVKSRSTQAKFKVTDEESFFAWAKDNMPEAVIIKFTPSLSVLKSATTIEATELLGLVAMTGDGEIIPGVQVEPAGINFSVEVSK